jgi:hypothetical protein|tara:strand:- start:223 stop:717 length:495 start_codon:yes stop_codon:yes gene_type:complete
MKDNIENVKLFNSKKIIFNNGVSIEFNEDKLWCKNNGNQEAKSIDSKYLDNFSYMECTQTKPIASPGLYLWIRVVIISIALFCLFLWLDWYTMVWYLFFLNLLAFILMAVDALIEANLFGGIIKRLYGFKVYRATFENKNGDNITFYASLDEETKLKEIRQTVD